MRKIFNWFSLIGLMLVISVFLFVIAKPQLFPKVIYKHHPRDVEVKKVIKTNKQERTDCVETLILNMIADDMSFVSIKRVTDELGESQYEFEHHYILPSGEVEVLRYPVVFK